MSFRKPMMNPRILSLVLAVVVLVGAIGCTHDDPPSPANRSVKYGTPSSANALDSESVDLDAVADLSMAFNRFARNASWEQAHRRVQSHLDYTSTTDLPQSIREQSAAYAMLSHHFTEAEPDPSPAKQRVVGLYMDRLIEHHSPESALAYPAITLLETHWSDDRLVSAIDSLLRRSQNAYAVRPASAGLHIPDVHADIRRANRALQEFRASLRSK